MTRQIEPEWDDQTRQFAEGLAQMGREECPGCGFHSSILADPEAHRYTFEHRVCEMCKAHTVYGRWLAYSERRTLKQLEDAPPMVPRPGDGRHIHLRPMTEQEKHEQPYQGGGNRGRSQGQRHP